jgi:small subunit ribosomal protein S9
MAQKLKKKTKQKQVIVKKATRVETAAHAAKRTRPQLKSTYVEAVGRRKTAVARVRIYEEKGDFMVNGKAVGEYFNSIPMSPTLYNKPLHITETLGRWSIIAEVSGSGVKAQLDAVVHGLARAIIAKDASHRISLKGAGLLTRDSRMKETRKVGMGGKARRQRQSPRR